MERIEVSKVLVVDDSKDFLQIALSKLSKRGIYILTAVSFEEAINILRKDNIETVILDFNKANATGLKVINYINTLKIKPTLVPLFFEDKLAHQSLTI
ncbi:MAG: response regulator [Bdellovibrionales bacterium]|nr:response regulator [Bdellovibrionales bacterium]